MINQWLPDSGAVQSTNLSLHIPSVLFVRIRCFVAMAKMTGTLGGWWNKLTED